jgi:hypothetical protein
MDKRSPIADNFTYSQINASGYPLNGRECWRHQLPMQFSEPVICLQISSSMQHAVILKFSHSQSIFRYVSMVATTIREFTLQAKTPLSILSVFSCTDSKIHIASLIT